MISKQRKQDIRNLIGLLKERPTIPRFLSMPAFSELTKVTAGPKKGQFFQLNDAPYLREPMELLSPDSHVQQVVCMMSAQSGKSVLGQIMTGFYSSHVPSEIIYATADLASARKTSERRLEPLFNSVGVKFKTQSENKSSRRSGDTALVKEFPGGCIDVVTANSPAALSAETKRIAIADEIDRWKISLGAEGSPYAQLYARLKAWQTEKKILAISTPTDEDVSLIFELFLMGDQREYFVPCPMCGKMQILTIKSKSGWGLDWETKNDKVIQSSIIYICKECSKSFNENKKYDILINGEWSPQGVPDDKFIASFHLSALNSNFESWYEIAKSYENSRENPHRRKEFVNLQEGLPFKQVGSRPKADAVIENKGDYLSGTVPDGVLYLTSGIDVQRGSDKWRDMSDDDLELAIAKYTKDGTIHKKRMPRLEYEVIGKGAGYRTWAISYKVFYGRVEDAFAGAWEKLNDYRVSLENENGRYGFKRMSDKWVFPVVQTLIDSGYKPETGDEGNPHVVYMFCGRWNATHPSKGFKLLKKNKIEQRKQTDRYDHIRYRWAKVDSGTTTLCEFSGNHYKQRIYNSLKIQRSEDDIQRPGFQDFPRDYPNRFFVGLTAEEKLIDGNYDNAGRWNDPLDIHVMAECAADVYLDKFTEIKRAEKKETGKFSQLQIKEAINHKYSILKLSKMAGIDKRYNEAPARRA